MVLDILAETKQNLKSLSIERPQRQREQLFIPEKDITEKDWGNILAALSQYREEIKLEVLAGANKRSWTRFFSGDPQPVPKNPQAIQPFIHLAANAVILSEERVASLHLDENDLSNIKLGFTLLSKPHPAAHNDVYSIRNMAGLKLLYPEEDIQSWSGTMDWLPFTTSFLSGSRDYPHEILEHSILYPNIVERVSIPDDLFATFSRLIQKDRKTIRKSRLLFERYLQFAVDCRGLFPDRFAELKIHEDIDLWKYMKDKLRQLRNEGDLIKFTKLASQMALLAAEKIEIADGRVKLTFPKEKNMDFASEPVPEQRNF